MVAWAVERIKTVGEFVMVTKGRTDSRNHLGSTEYLVEAHKDGVMVHSERHSWTTWEGHCCGIFLVPLIAERAALKVGA